ncbi:CAP domain-containing protein [Flavobacterium sp. 25HG05S-40]|uniref:CAP domain-containing protein n=1 Tax=Flavobacterium sp. 25HG05S-40 TaxID=3458682 RepID=UPI004043C785
MTTIVYILFLVAIIGFVVYSATRKRKTSEPPVIKIYPHYEPTPLDLEVVRLINEYRINLDLRVFTIDEHINNVANSHSLYMAKKKKPSHDYATERQNQFPNKRVGEIVAYNFQSAASVVAGWKNSPGHDKAMRNPEYLNIGIATATDINSKLYYTVIFTT